MKMTWQTPTLETLDVNMTMAGSGHLYVDWSYVGGLHLELNDDPKNSGFPAPPIPPVS